MQAWRSDKFFDNVFQLVGVPVITVQLRYDGWVTEMQVRRIAGCCVGQTLAEPCKVTLVVVLPCSVLCCSESGCCWFVLYVVLCNHSKCVSAGKPLNSRSWCARPGHPRFAGPVKDEGHVGQCTWHQQPAVQVRYGWSHQFFTVLTGLARTILLPAIYTLPPVANLPPSSRPLPLCSADADFSCFADLALTSPVDYFKQGQGSLMQCVLTPADPYLPKTNEDIAAEVDKQVRKRGSCCCVHSLCV
jgi:hypothetical protein